MTSVNYQRTTFMSSTGFAQARSVAHIHAGSMVSSLPRFLGVSPWRYQRMLELQMEFPNLERSPSCHNLAHIHLLCKPLWCSASGRKHHRGSFQNSVQAAIQSGVHAFSDDSSLEDLWSVISHRRCLYHVC